LPEEFGEDVQFLRKDHPQPLLFARKGRGWFFYESIQEQK
jgi:hypothetical protein